MRARISDEIYRSEALRRSQLSERMSTILGPANEDSSRDSISPFSGCLGDLQKHISSVSRSSCKTKNFTPFTHRYRSPKQCPTHRAATSRVKVFPSNRVNNSSYLMIELQHAFLPQTSSTLTSILLQLQLQHSSVSSAANLPTTELPLPLSLSSLRLAVSKRVDLSTYAFRYGPRSWRYSTPNNGIFGKCLPRFCVYQMSDLYSHLIHSRKTSIIPR
jgi:hypothetical protein